MSYASPALDDLRRGPLDIVLDPAVPRVRRSLPATVWLLAYLLWAAGLLGVGFSFASHPGTLPWTVRPTGWWHWLGLSGAGSLLCAVGCVLQRRR